MEMIFAFFGVLLAGYQGVTASTIKTKLLEQVITGTSLSSTVTVNVQTFA